MTEEKKDMINHPPHYTDGGVEVIDVIRAKLTKEEFSGYLLGNAIKYLLRCNYKTDKSGDIKKGAMVYQLLDRKCSLGRLQRRCVSRNNENN